MKYNLEILETIKLFSILVILQPYMLPNLLHNKWNSNNKVNTTETIPTLTPIIKIPSLPPNKTKIKIKTSFNNTNPLLNNNNKIRISFNNTNPLLNNSKIMGNFSNINLLMDNKILDSSSSIILINFNTKIIQINLKIINNQMNSYNNSSKLINSLNPLNPKNKKNISDSLDLL